MRWNSLTHSDTTKESWPLSDAGFVAPLPLAKRTSRTDTAQNAIPIMKAGE